MRNDDWRIATVTSTRVVAHDVLELRLEDPRGKALPPWEPGSHLEIETPHGIRQYSMCGDPGENAYTIAVLREESGRGGSRALHTGTEVRSEVRIRGPHNHFPLAPEADRYLLIAGGIGITPLKAMAEKLAATGREWQLHYGGRDASSMAYAQDLLALAPSRVHLHPESESGLLDLASILSDTDSETVVYCCGPPGLLDAAATAVADSPAHSLHVERFTAAPPPPEPVDAPPSEGFVVELAASGLEVTVAPGQTILDAVREKLPDVMSSCEDGYCGTCETQVLEGVPLHRDTVLTPSEQESNETMMICVGRSCTARLVLDL